MTDKAKLPPEVQAICAALGIPPDAIIAAIGFDDDGARDEKRKMHVERHPQICGMADSPLIDLVTMCDLSDALASHLMQGVRYTGDMVTDKTNACSHDVAVMHVAALANVLGRFSYTLGWLSTVIPFDATFAANDAEIATKRSTDFCTELTAIISAQLSAGSNDALAASKGVGGMRAMAQKASKTSAAAWAHNYPKLARTARKLALALRGVDYNEPPIV